MSDFEPPAIDDMPLSDLEHLVARAGDYLQVSADLRPHVLETARTRQRKESIRRWSSCLLAAALLYFAALPRSSTDSHPTTTMAEREPLAADSITPVGSRLPDRIETEWRLVHRNRQIKERRRRVFWHAL